MKIKKIFVVLLTFLLSFSIVNAQEPNKKINVTGDTFEAILTLDDLPMAPGDSITKTFILQNDTDMDYNIIGFAMDNVVVEDRETKKAITGGIKDEFTSNISFKLYSGNQLCFEKSMSDLETEKVVFEPVYEFKKNAEQLFKIEVFLDQDSTINIQNLKAYFDMGFVCEQIPHKSNGPSHSHSSSYTVKKPVDLDPVIILRGKNTIVITQGDEFDDPGVSVYDNEDEDIADKVYITYNNIKGKLDTNKTGKYKVTYHVEDSAGNKASVSRTLIIEKKLEPKLMMEELLQEIKKPVIKLNGNTRIEINQGEIFVDPGAKAYDELDGDISDKIKVRVNGVEGSVDTNVPGNYIITYNVSNEKGVDADEMRREVTVKKPEVIKMTDSLPKTGEGSHNVYYGIGVGCILLGVLLKVKALKVRSK